MRDYILLEMLKDACKAFLFGGLLVCMWICFAACTTASETARLDAAIRAEALAERKISPFEYRKELRALQGEFLEALVNADND